MSYNISNFEAALRNLQHIDYSLEYLNKYLELLRLNIYSLERQHQEFHYIFKDSIPECSDECKKETSFKIGLYKIIQNYLENLIEI